MFKLDNVNVDTTKDSDNFIPDIKIEDCIFDLDDYECSSAVDTEINLENEELLIDYDMDQQLDIEEHSLSMHEEPSHEELSISHQSIGLTSNEVENKITPKKLLLVNKEYYKEKLLEQEASTSYSHIQLYKCSICEIYFAVQDDLKKHMICHDSDDKTINNSKSTLKCRNLKINADTQTFKCKFCYKYVGKGELYQHLKIHLDFNKFECNICKKLFSEEEFNRHLKTHTVNKEYKCVICKKFYSSKYTFNRHLLRHTGVEERKCEICKKIYSDKYSFKRHLQAHSDVKKYKCESCSKSFGQELQLISHLKTHTDI